MPAAMPLIVIIRVSSIAAWKGCLPSLWGSRDSSSMISDSLGWYKARAPLPSLTENSRRLRRACTCKTLKAKRSRNPIITYCVQMQPWDALQSKRIMRDVVQAEFPTWTGAFAAPTAV
eukprot:GHRR01020883.1.p1 GENE.GHRR01020883.1~~GHRR01020883.1.p1  ORF type:complete len:118 (-),score=16.21 GHRR01020883.1:157-510(-)